MLNCAFIGPELSTQELNKQKPVADYAEMTAQETENLLNGVSRFSLTEEELKDKEVRSKILGAFKQLKDIDKEICFYSSGMGYFVQTCDDCFAFLSLLEDLKLSKTACKKNTLKLILPLELSISELYEEHPHIADLYDEIILPTEFKANSLDEAIPRRNRWMIDQCFHIITYIDENSPKAGEILDYAKEKGVTVFNLAKD